MRKAKRKEKKKLTLPKLTENIFSAGCCFRFVSGTKCFRTVKNDNFCQEKVSLKWKFLS